MRGNRQVARLRQPCHAHPIRDPADVAHVRLGESNIAPFQHVAEFVERMQILASGDRHAFAGDPRMAAVIVRYRRLFQPGQLKFAQGARGAAGLFHRPAHIGVGHQRDIRADQLPHCRHPSDIFPQSLAAHLDLDGPKAALQVLLRLFEQTLGGELQVDAAGVGPRAAMSAAEVTPERFVRPAGAPIPERNIDRGNGEGSQATAADIVAAPPELLPDLRAAAGVSPQQDGRQCVVDERTQRFPPRPMV